MFITNKLFKKLLNIKIFQLWYFLNTRHSQKCWKNVLLDLVLIYDDCHGISDFFHIQNQIAIATNQVCTQVSSIIALYKITMETCRLFSWLFLVTAVLVGGLYLTSASWSMDIYSFHKLLNTLLSVMLMLVHIYLRYLYHLFLI